MRQFFVANNLEELPFNRIEHSWFYAFLKKRTTIKVLALIVISMHTACIYQKQDDHFNIHLVSSCSYKKSKVVFNGIQELKDCSYLGSQKGL
jgi:hypothetical protein